MSTTRQDLVPNFITAESPRGLRRSMFLTNQLKGGECQYFDIQSYNESGKTKWIAWFFEKTELKDIDVTE